MNSSFTKLLSIVIISFAAIVIICGALGIKTNSQKRKDKVDTMMSQMNYSDIETGMRKIAEDSDNVGRPITQCVYAYFLNDSIYYCAISVPFKYQKKVIERIYKRLYDCNNDKFYSVSKAGQICCKKKYAKLDKEAAEDMDIITVHSSK